MSHSAGQKSTIGLAKIQPAELPTSPSALDISASSKPTIDSSQEDSIPQLRHNEPPSYSAERIAHKVSGRQLIALAFSSLGIIYSDIGTSPLYVLSTIWNPTSAPPTEEDVIGGISAIVWAFTLLPFIKYVLVALTFGSKEGEGGPFALFLQLYPPASHDDATDNDRSLTKFNSVDWRNGTPPSDKSHARRLLDKYRWPLQIWALFATALQFADGSLTAAVSVTSSVGGLAVVAPVVSENVKPISIGFLAVLFLGQRLGTARLSFIFAPVTVIWLGLIGMSGYVDYVDGDFAEGPDRRPNWRASIANVTTYPGILRAFDPSRAILFFVRTKNFDALGGVLLALTGCEAIFANLGQFSAGAIRLSFVTIVYPSLIFAYLGQGARFIVDGARVIENPFYLSIPGGEGRPLWWITWIFGVFATLVASQAMITATFSLVHQLIGMKCFPPIRINFTSKKTVGQVYISLVNWVLAIMTIALVGGFGSSFALTLAYGFAVATVMFVTTTFITLHIPLIKGLHWTFALAFFLCFGFLDSLFWGAALKKVPEGAWLPLAIGVAISAFLIFWTWARGLEDNFDRVHKRNLTRLVFKDVGRVATDKNMLDLSRVEHHSSSEMIASNAIKDNMQSTTKPEVGDKDEPERYYIEQVDKDIMQLARTPTVAVFHKSAKSPGVPHAFGVFLRQVPALPQLVIFLTTQVMPVPHINSDDRYSLFKVRSLNGFYGVTMRQGYLDHLAPEMEIILARIRATEIALAGSPNRDLFGVLDDASVIITHVLPHYCIISRSEQAFGPLRVLRRGLLEDVYAPLRYMFPDAATLELPLEQTLRIGVAAPV